MKKIMKKRWLIFVILMISFIIIAINVVKDNFIYIDTNIYKVISLLKSTNMTLFLKIFTNISGSIVLIVLSILLFFAIKKRKYGILIIINLINTVIINLILKNIFMRQRPVDLMLIQEKGFSFPSGHAMASMSFYGFLIFLIWQTELKKKNKLIISILIALIIVGVCISRIYLGVHYFSDVLGGCCISLAYLIIFANVSLKYLNKE